LLTVAEQHYSTGEHQCCHTRVNGECRVDLWRHPPGVPAMLSMVYRIFGVSHRVAFYFSSFANSLSAVMVFLITYQLFRNRMLGLLAAFAFTFRPLPIISSLGFIHEPFLNLVLLISIYVLLLFLRKKSFSLLILTIASFFLGVQFKAEAIVLVAMLGVGTIDIYWKSIYSYTKSLAWNRMVFLAVLILVLSLLTAPLMFHINKISYSQKDPDFGVEYLETNHEFLTDYWMNGAYVHKPVFIVFFLLFIVGIITLLKNKKYDSLAFLTFWWLAINLFYAFYSWSAYRFILHAVAPFVIIYTYGFVQILPRIKALRILGGGIFIIFLILMMTTAVRQYTPETKYEYIMNSMDMFQDNCVVVTEKKIYAFSFIVMTGCDSFPINVLDTVDLGSLGSNIYFFHDYSVEQPDKMKPETRDIVAEHFDISFVSHDGNEGMGYRYAFSKLTLSQHGE